MIEQTLPGTTGSEGICSASAYIVGSQTSKLESASDFDLDLESRRARGLTRRRRYVWKGRSGGVGGGTKKEAKGVYKLATSDT